MGLAKASEDRAKVRRPVSPPSELRAFPKGKKGLAPVDGRVKPKGSEHMPLYEHVFLARQDVTAQQVEELTTRFKGVIEANGGSVGKTEYWGVKSLTYRINKNRKAHFTLLNIDAPAAAVQELERQQRIDEDVLRILTLRVEEHEEGPSAMLQKRDRDDRGERGERGDRGDRGDRFGGREDRPRRPRPTDEVQAEEGN